MKCSMEGIKQLQKQNQAKHLSSNCGKGKVIVITLWHHMVMHDKIKKYSETIAYLSKVKLKGVPIPKAHRTELTVKSTVVN